MPRLSLWRENKGNDYKFLDRRISEMFTVGGTGIQLHKYLGTESTNAGTDATKPDYVTQSELNIQDLLFVENRDRKYDTDIYELRGIYQKQDQDFDLSQFGLFLAAGTQFMTFHLNDMVETVGRKIIAGDVLELMHLKDYHSLDQSVPFAIKRYYVVSDASWAAEGFSPTWYPHLWRVKLQPLVDSQEYKDIINKIGASNDPFAGNVGSNANPALSSIVSTYDRYKDINEAVIAQAEVELPKSGYNTANLFVVAKDSYNRLQSQAKADTTSNVDVSGATLVTLTTANARVNTNRILVSNARSAIVGATITTANILANAGVTVTGIIGTNGIILSSNITIGAGETISLRRTSALNATSGNSAPLAKVQGYLSGDGSAPNGLQVNMGVAFPSNKKVGDYFLRLDFVPNRLFRFDGKRWVKIEDAVRTSLTPGSVDNKTQRSGFVNNTNTFTNSQGDVFAERISLSQVIKPEADN
jgi:hypothetical protein